MRTRKWARELTPHSKFGPNNDVNTEEQLFIFKTSEQSQVGPILIFAPESFLQKTNIGV